MEHSNADLNDISLERPILDPWKEMVTAHQTYMVEAWTSHGIVSGDGRTNYKCHVIRSYVLKSFALTLTNFVQSISNLSYPDIPRGEQFIVI